MSVYKSRRKDAAAQFIADARELRKYTVRVTRKFPKSYRDITNGLLELAREIYLNAIKGNAIYLHKDMSEHDYELRHRYLMIACSSADAICGEITFCYEMVDAGNNFFAGKAEYEKAFQTWTTLANNALSRLRAVLESDKSVGTDTAARRRRPGKRDFVGQVLTAPPAIGGSAPSMRRTRTISGSSIRTAATATTTRTTRMALRRDLRTDWARTSSEM